MVRIFYRSKFKKEISRIKDNLIKERILKQILKIKNNPNIGKPMKHKRKGTRELYIPPFRLSYIYKKGLIIILALYHKNNQ